MAIFAVSILSQRATGKPTARDDKKARRVLWYPTQAKERLDPDFLPRCAREIRVCAFH
jgi:hypothetical protein